MAITSFYLLNMFPRMRTLHHHRTINTQQPSQTCSLRCALYIITEQSTPNTQTKHVPSDTHFTSSPNSQHPTPRPNMFLQMRTLLSSPNNQHPTPKPNIFPQMRTLHHHLTVNTQHPDKHVPSDAHFTSSPNSQHSTAMTVIQ